MQCEDDRDEDRRTANIGRARDLTFLTCVGLPFGCRLFGLTRFCHALPRGNGLHVTQHGIEFVRRLGINFGQNGPEQRHRYDDHRQSDEHL